MSLHGSPQARRGSIRAHSRHLSIHDGEVGGRIHTVALEVSAQAHKAPKRHPCELFLKILSTREPTRHPPT